MPLVGQVGRRSSRVRLLFLAAYLILTAGAVTMVYPFLLMAASSTCSLADQDEYKVVPSYWTSDAALFKKYLVDVTSVDELSVWFGRDDWFTPRDIEDAHLKPVMDMPAARRQAMAGDVRDFIATACPGELKMPLFANPESPLSLNTEYLDWVKQRYGTLERTNQVYVDNAADWNELSAPVEQMHRATEKSRASLDRREFLETRSPNRTGMYDPDLDVLKLIRTIQIPPDSQWARSGSKKLSLVTYDDIAAGRLGEDARRQFIAGKAWAKFIRIDTRTAEPAWRQFLAKRGSAALALTERIPSDERSAGLWSQFVLSSCPLDAVTLLRPEIYWRKFLQTRYASVESLNRAYGTSYASFDEARIPYAVFHCDSFLKQKNALKRQYLGYNFGEVLSFITVHGRALLVTLLFILLTIATTLTVNPLAAYAMSRFRLRESYHLLVFMLATMAFPGEVLMIPSFLMIKSFPLGHVAVVGVCLLGFALLGMKLKRKMPPVIGVTVALVVTAAVAGWLVPWIAGLLHIKTSVSLMNTFWALILPGLANGYGIFLLKGFFDSLPPELYEAGLIDGASEMTMFRKITLPLCKPILAVMVLGAFAGAYGAFMHAFLVCQDPRMWTLMVFLYEFQQNHGTPMIMASLVIAAIPTLLVFIACQGVILRGIIIPTYK